MRLAEFAVIESDQDRELGLELILLEVGVDLLPSAAADDSEGGVCGSGCEEIQEAGGEGVLFQDDPQEVLGFFGHVSTDRGMVMDLFTLREDMDHHLGFADSGVSLEVFGMRDVGEVHLLEQEVEGLPMEVLGDGDHAVIVEEDPEGRLGGGGMGHCGE